MRLTNLWNAEPIRVLLLGLAGVVDVVLIALEINGVTHLGAAGCTAIVAAVSAVCALAAEVLRAAVSPNATVSAVIDKALEVKPPHKFHDELDRQAWLAREERRIRKSVMHGRRAA